MEDDSRMVEWGETPQLGEVICREPLQGMGTAISGQRSAISEDIRVDSRSCAYAES